MVNYFTFHFLFSVSVSVSCDQMRKKPTFFFNVFISAPSQQASVCPAQLFWSR